MTVRAAEPPQLKGYSPVRLIGSGGYANVFLYEQNMPRRLVAVKVLATDSLSDEAQRRQFTAEANLMARVSAHPFIVPIFAADVAADGRPYIVMEYYPGENFLHRARQELFGVAEVLRVGIQVGSALETAHRAGILHRDIKPANILTSEFRRPGLADFGIASVQGHDGADAAGLSVPWAPPEAFGDAELGLAADVYSLAATLYHLLAGRSPFEMVGGDNSALGLMSRIERAQLPLIGRPEVPQSLHRVLAQAMAKQPAHRPATVVDFLRQLQAVEAELLLAVTPLELAEDAVVTRARVALDDDDATRVKGVTEIRGQSPIVAIDHVPVEPVISAPRTERSREELPVEQPLANTVHRTRPSVVSATDAEQIAPEPRWRTPLLAGVGGAFLLGAVVITVMLTAGGGGESSPTTGSTMSAIVVIGDDSPAAVVAVDAVLGADGTAWFSWTAPDAMAGDWYVVRREDTQETQQVDVTSVVLSEAAAGLCVTVWASRAGVPNSDGKYWCVTP